MTIFVPITIIYVPVLIIFVLHRIVNVSNINIFPKNIHFVCPLGPKFGVTPKNVPIKEEKNSLVKGRGSGIQIQPVLSDT